MFHNAQHSFIFIICNIKIKRIVSTTIYLDISYHLTTRNSNINNTYPYYKYRKTGKKISNFNAKYKISIVDTFS